jgi:hypothetical protein
MGLAWMARMLGEALKHAVPGFEGSLACYVCFMRDNVHERTNVLASELCVCQVCQILQAAWKLMQDSDSYETFLCVQLGEKQNNALSTLRCIDPPPSHLSCRSVQICLGVCQILQAA